MVSYALAGERAGRSREAKEIRLSIDMFRYEAGVFDGANSYNGKNGLFPYEFPEGTLLGRLSNGKWTPLKLTRADGAGEDATSLVVDDSRFFKVGDTITVGEDSEVEITAINYSTDTLTIAASTWADRAFIAADGDLAGAGVPKAIMNEFINTEDPDLRTVTDRKAWNFLTFGWVIDDLIVGDLAAAKAYIAANGGLKGIFFQSEIA